MYSPNHNSTHYENLVTCASVWSCPVCSAKISERRRVELEAAMAAWPGLCLLVTFTLRHQAGDSLAKLLKGLRESYRALRGGKAWIALRDKHGINGSITALEVTYGLHGWHPHLHVLLFVAPDIDLWQLANDLKTRWSAVVQRVGLTSSLHHGVDVRLSAESAAEYVAKFGRDDWTLAHELTKASSKLGRGESVTTRDLLLDSYRSSDRECGALWKEYATTFKGRTQLKWTPGLRGLLLPGSDDLTDEELAKEDSATSFVLASLTREQWRFVLANDARADLLTVARSGNADDVWDYLYRLGAPMDGNDRFRNVSCAC
jgi:hypothetical protein